MLEKLIKSRTRLKLLKIFFLNRERDFYLRELAKVTGENLNSVGRELKNLLSAGLIKERARGNQKLYTVNKLSPAHEELRKLILKTAAIGDVLREKMSKVGNIRYSLIYGSFAAGTEGDESDIDLLVIGNADEEKLIKATAALEKELSREINFILWSEKEFQKKAREKHHLILDIIEKPLVMVIGDENEFRKSAEERDDSKHKG